MRRRTALTVVVATGLALAAWASAGSVRGPSANAACVGGSITASGSTALLPLAQKAAQDYHAQCAKASITVSGGGSSAGLSNVNGGASDIGMSDVPSSAAKGVDQANLQDHQVAIVIFAVVVSDDSGVTDLTTKQVQDVFSGKITNWAEVGGHPENIALYERKPGSGTRFTFDKCVMGDVAQSTSPAAQEDSTQLVIQAIQKSAGAVSYVNVASLKGASGVHAVKLNGAAADGPSVANGSYTFFSHEHMYTRVKPAPPALAADYIQFIMTPTYQSGSVAQAGYAPLSTTSRLSLADK
ncbi:MAG: substrate-binding domain-containing protein [Acidimicrobiia bacterium]|nr:substrate-binding domain-containing protein [Acidimicrobiia bacterium]